jgi:hypothetical protein
MNKKFFLKNMENDSYIYIGIYIYIYIGIYIGIIKSSQ